MAKVYIKVGTDFEDIRAISTINTVDFTIEAILDDDCIYVDKLIGYKAYATDEKPMEYHLKFDEDKYEKYITAQKEAEEELKKQSALNDTRNEVLNLISVTEEESDKEGFKFKVYKIGDLVVKKEYIEIPIVNDGSDYTKPLTYEVGMEVAEGLWYTDGTDVWECIKSGTPTSFEDKEYFDIVEV